MKLFLTAVVPAIHGCNLKCAGCIIDQRKEATEIVLSHEGYISFFKRCLPLPEVQGFSIQGHEALLPSAWPLTRELLRRSTEIGIVTSCVTNGVYLDRYAHEIVHITDGLTVSVDSHDSVHHDLTRGKIGAWADTIRGIEATREQFGDSSEGKGMFQDYLKVASILYPGQTDRLLGMPKLLVELGLKHWVITPLITLRKGAYHDTNLERVRDNLILLTNVAKEHGIEAFVGDDLRNLEDVGDIYELLAVDNLEKDVIITRLSPDARLSVGRKILEVSGVQWDQKEDPVQFLRRVVQQSY
jgi:MoaA/NifB/PqqE/SkfB family radical SAM enzyme